MGSSISSRKSIRRKNARGVQMRGSCMTNLWTNIRFGFRILRKDLGLTIVALLALTLGIGANTAIFTVVYGSLIAPMPYPNPNQLVMVWSKVNDNRNGVSAGDYLDWKNQSSVFQDLGAWNGSELQSFALWPSGNGADPHSDSRLQQYAGLAVHPGAGIFFRKREKSAKDHVAILTHSLWESRFGSDPHIIGQNIRLERPAIHGGWSSCRGATGSPGYSAVRSARFQARADQS